MEESTPAPDELDRRVRSFLTSFALGRALGIVGLELARLETRERDRFGAAVARIAARDPDPAMRHVALSFIFAKLSGPFSSRRSRESFARSAGPVLLEAFESPETDDDRRWLIGPMMELCGVRMPSDRYAAAFEDFEGAHRRMVRAAVERFTNARPGR